jgi:hypothetical protein
LAPVTGVNGVAAWFCIRVVDAMAWVAVTAPVMARVNDALAEAPVPVSVHVTV